MFCKLAIIYIYKDLTVYFTLCRHRVLYAFLKNLLPTKNPRTKQILCPSTHPSTNLFIRAPSLTEHHTKRKLLPTNLNTTPKSQPLLNQLVSRRQRHLLNPPILQLPRHRMKQQVSQAVSLQLPTTRSPKLLTAVKSIRSQSNLTINLHLPPTNLVTNPLTNRQFHL